MESSNRLGIKGRISFSFVLIIPICLLLCGKASAQLDQKLWRDRAFATYEFMQKKMWNPTLGNFMRHTAAPPQAQKSDAWGITIVLDAFSYMVEAGMMQPLGMKQYFESSTGLYERTMNGRGARIIAKQGSQIYVGGDDDLQWIAALVHCYEATKDKLYLEEAKSTFNGLIALEFWKKDPANGAPAGWAWNSNDQRPMGVSTAYGALAAARLFKATGDQVYKQWAEAALNALKQKQISFIPRDKMIAAEAYAILSNTAAAKKLADEALSEVHNVLIGKTKGERNPTDVADLAEGAFGVSKASGDAHYAKAGETLIEFFIQDRSIDDIKANGFYSRYETNGKPDKTGSYLGVPNNAQYLPEVAEMLKLTAMMAK